MPAPLSLERQLALTKLPNNSWVSFQIDKSTDWLKELLQEMNENATIAPAHIILSQTSIELKIELMRKFKGEIGEYVLARGCVEATYATECVRTLRPMQEKLKTEFKSCFAPEALLKSEEYAETSEIWLDGDTWELYAYTKNQLDIAEMVHEQAYLSYNYYPRIDAEAPLNEDLPDDKTRQ